LNLRDSGFEVVIGLRSAAPSANAARADGLRVISIEEAASFGDVVMVLIPDEEQPAVFLDSIVESLRSGTYLAFAHGFAIHFGSIVAPSDINVFMVAPKAPGPLVRSEYEKGRGVPCLIAIHQDPSGNSSDVALAYASAIGAGHAGIVETTFREETETDLFGEQAVLCGGLTSLVVAGFETLVGAGYSPEMAYFECVHELKLIVDLIHAQGIEGMRDCISNTARFGDYSCGQRVIGESSRKAMRDLLLQIQDGTFAREWATEHSNGKPRLLDYGQSARKHEIEQVGARLRSFMPWLRERTEATRQDEDLKFRVC
jgi:ketol-acid reductoisomerase